MTKMNLPNGTNVVLTSTGEHATIIGREESDFIVPRYVLNLRDTNEQITVTAFEIESYSKPVKKEFKKEQKGISD